MFIIYSNHQTSIGAAINLATPHLTTPYAFIMDNDVRLPHGAVGKMLRSAKENSYGIVCPQDYAAAPRDTSEFAREESAQGLGLRTCFLASQEALVRLGKFEENASPFTVGIHIRMAAEELGIPIHNEVSAQIELEHQSLLWPMDVPLHSFQWNAQRVRQSLACLEKKWGIHLQEQDYALWLERKKKDLEESKNIFSFLGNLISKMKSSGREKERKSPNRFVLPKAA